MTHPSKGLSFPNFDAKKAGHCRSFPGNQSNLSQSLDFPSISPSSPSFSQHFPGLVSGPVVAAPIMEVPSAAPGLTVEMELELISEKESMAMDFCGKSWEIGEHQRVFFGDDRFF